MRKGVTPPKVTSKWSAHCLCLQNVICFSEFVLISQNLEVVFCLPGQQKQTCCSTLTHTANDSWLYKGCHCRLRANLFPDTHAASAVSVPPSLAFNCTWYLSAGADHITSGSSSCLCWRPIPLYTPHFPSCPSDCVECQLLGALGFCINYRRLQRISSWWHQCMLGREGERAQRR